MAQANANAVDIEELVNQFNLTAQAQAAQNDALNAQQANLNASVERGVAAIQGAGQAEADIQAIVDGIIIKRAGRNADAAASFGTNPDAHTYVIDQLAQRSRANAEKLIASAQSLQAKMSVGPGDDVLEWIGNQFTLPNDAQAHNALAVEQEVVNSTINALQNQTQEQFKINNQIDASTTKDLTRLNQQRILYAATVRAEQARQEALKTNIQVDSIRLATNQQAFTNILALNRAKIDLQQIQIANEENELQRKLRAERLAKMERETLSDAELKVDLDRISAVLGIRNITPEQFRRMQGPVRAAIEYAMLDPSISQGRLGPNPVRAVETADSLNAPLTPATTDVKNALINMMVTARTRPEYAALKPEQKQVAENKAIQDRIDRDLRNIPDSGSIFSAPPLMSLGKIPAVEATQLWKERLAPMAKNPMVPTSAQQVFNSALAAVREGKMTLEQASGEMSVIYKSAVADNWYNRDYGRFSLKIPEQFRHSYYTRLPEKLFGDTTPVDLTNPTAIKNTMLRHLNTERMLQQGPGSMTFINKDEPLLP